MTSVESLPSWASTLLGLLAAMLTAVIPMVPSPWNLIPIGLAAAISAVLGYAVRSSAT
jgi:CDP-diglyceride synthetase